MKNLPLIASALYLEPWFLRGDVHVDLSRQFREYLAGNLTADKALSDGRVPISDVCRLGDRSAANDPVGGKWRNRWTGEEGFYHPQVEVSEGIAYLKCEGMIGKHLSNFEMSCFGGIDLAILEKQMANVRDDKNVHTLILDLNTPGGRAQGCEAAALAIREVVDAGKRVVAYADTCCCSAGYFLASAASEFIVHQDAIIGSISTICAGVDDSRAWEMEGLKLKLVATGPLKAVGHPGREWSEDDMNFLRERAQVVDDVFKGFVRKHRGLDDAAMNGAHWYARAAPEGLCDGFGRNIEEVIRACVKAK